MSVKEGQVTLFSHSSDGVWACRTPLAAWVGYTAITTRHNTTQPNQTTRFPPPSLPPHLGVGPVGGTVYTHRRQYSMIKSFRTTSRYTMSTPRLGAYRPLPG